MEMSSVGQLQAEMIGRPGLLGLWIIHKPNNPGRPIISACSCPTELISSFLDKKMAPFVKSLPTYIKDTNHALNILKQFSFPGNNKFLFTMD